MVDISEKPELLREAVARGRIKVGSIILNKMKEFKLDKGDVVCVARVASILAAKQTSQLIPMCHQIELSKVDVIVEFDELGEDIVVEVKVRTSKHATGVEMEALVATSVGLLTIYDMCKSAAKLSSHEMTIYDVRLVSKVKRVV